MVAHPESYWTMIRELVKTELDARIWTDKPIELLIVNPKKFTKQEIKLAIDWFLVRLLFHFYQRMITRRSVVHFRITMYGLRCITGQKDGLVGYMLIEAMGIIPYLLGQTGNLRGTPKYLILLFPFVFFVNKYILQVKLH